MHTQKIVYPFKNKVMSIIVSEKTYHPGHQYRYQIISHILKSNREIDIYGKGCKFLGNDYRIKGEFKNHSEALSDYHYSIAIENTMSTDYISEKFTLCLAYNTVPIYYGAENVEKYFGGNCCYQLTGELERDVALIFDLYDNYLDRKLPLNTAQEHLDTGNASLKNYLEHKWR